MSADWNIGQNAHTSYFDKAPIYVNMCTFVMNVSRSTFKAIVIRLRYDYDEKLTCSVFARVLWKQARAMRRGRIVVVSQSNRNCNHGVTLTLSVILGIPHSLQFST